MCTCSKALPKYLEEKTCRTCYPGGGGRGIGIQDIPKPRRTIRKVTDGLSYFLCPSLGTY